MTEPALRLDPDSSLPLYRQMVVTLRYRIATGELERGEHLPSLRDAAAAWGANYHTVRRAYEELEAMGLVERRRGAGTVVTSKGLGRFPAGQAALLRDFLGEVRDRAEGDFGLSVDEVAVLLTESLTRSVSGAPVTMVECNAHQCRDLADQIRERWLVDVEERILGDGPAPGGPIIGTFFHYAELRRAWPKRRDRMYFPTLQPDPALRDRLEESEGDGPEGAPLTVPLCERDEAMGEVMAADLGLILPAERFRLRAVISDDPREVLETTGGPVLFAPRLWNDLDAQGRSDPRAIEARYTFRLADLRAIGRELGWEERSAHEARPRRAPIGNEMTAR